MIIFFLNHQKKNNKSNGGPIAICEPLMISKDENEKCLIEVAVNSVRVSFAFRKQSDEVERELVQKYTRFLTQRASTTLDILRKKPLDGWDISFLFTAHMSYLPPSLSSSGPGLSSGVGGTGGKKLKKFVPYYYFFFQ